MDTTDYVFNVWPHSYTLRKIICKGSVFDKSKSSQIHTIHVSTSQSGVVIPDQTAREIPNFPLEQPTSSSMKNVLIPIFSNHIQCH